MPGLPFEEAHLSPNFQHAVQKYDIHPFVSCTNQLVTTCQLIHRRGRWSGSFGKYISPGKGIYYGTLRRRKFPSRENLPHFLSNQGARPELPLIALNHLIKILAHEKKIGIVNQLRPLQVVSRFLVHRPHQFR